MNEKLNFPGGEPNINFDDLNRDDTANRSALFGIMKAFNIGTNENFIISGCVATVDTGVDVDVTAGYIFLNEEILQVEAQTVVDGGTLDLYKYVKSTTYDINGTKTFNNAVSRQTWAKYRGIVTAATTPIITTELDVVNGDRLTDKINIAVGKAYQEIGVWDMDVTPGIVVTHPTGITFADIIGCRILIVNTAADSKKSISVKDVGSATPAGSYNVGTLATAIDRTTGGDFDHVDYNGTAANRGWIIYDTI